ncbi:hypothetical protein JOF46_002338 [Paeniglutamicibacter psychrophenolicus]|uniref:Uncharacterized protein n=1 Tax=Paeniglutamicibacter psychrophenolicus TaxID=257454 RepID=A0ABS4WEF4_9MICC|nr:hypothetical protein [Paeniglutamicibacter psychrophenolicus]
MGKKRVFIYGGCTSRDAVEHYPAYSMELAHYVVMMLLLLSTAFRDLFLQPCPVTFNDLTVPAQTTLNP